MDRLTLYYDGQCNLCAREIALLRRLVPEGVAFSDIHHISDYSGLPSRETLLKRLHLQSETGKWFLGLDATVEIWSKTRFGLFFRCLKLPGIRRVAQKLYQRWADRRYCSRYGVCDAPASNPLRRPE